MILYNNFHYKIVLALNLPACYSSIALIYILHSYKQTFLIHDICLQKTLLRNNLRFKTLFCLYHETYYSWTDPHNSLHPNKYIFHIPPSSHQQTALHKSHILHHYLENKLCLSHEAFHWILRFSLHINLH